MVWMTTFNDLMTLLMVFFVLLFAMGSLDSQRFQNFQNGLQSAMGVLNEGRHAAEGLISDRQGAVADRPVEESPAGDRPADFQELIRTTGLEAEYTHKGIRLTLNDQLLFQSGSAALTEDGLRLLGQIIAVVKPMQRQVRIEGHTDDRPIATSRYPSNWELSTARAIGVVNFFIDHGGIPASFFSAAGYGSFRPRVPNDSEAHRAVNRRVEIILGHVAASGPDA